MYVNVSPPRSQDASTTRIYEEPKPARISGRERIYFDETGMTTDSPVMLSVELPFEADRSTGMEPLAPWLIARGAVGSSIAATARWGARKLKSKDRGGPNVPVAADR